MAEISAGIYCRISLAAIGDTTKTDDQARICRDLAGRLGWSVNPEVGHPDADGIYTDHARSAWQKKRKRPAWDQMLADVNAGKINAIIVYHGDRLVRRPEDLTDLLRLADSKGVKLASPTGTKDLDTERLELWIRAAFAEEESQRHSERRKAQYERWRREGKVRPGGRGGRAFGFTTRNEIIGAEADAVRLMCNWVLSGRGARAVAAEATGLGWQTPAGGPFTHTTVRKMLARPRYAGLMPDGVAVASWPAILDRADWEAVSAVLDARASGYGYATNGRRYLLSGIATCGECHQPLAAWGSKGRNGTYVVGYTCLHDGCRKVSRSVPLLDAYTGRRVVSRLNNPANPAGRVSDRPGLSAELAALTQARADLAARVADPGQPHLDLLLSRLNAVDARLGRLRDSAGDAARVRLLAAHQGMTWDEWEAAELGVKRALVAATFHVEVLRSSKRGPGFRTEDVRMTPR